MNNNVGIESALGFGDCVFNISLIKKISERHNCPITVATKHENIDAFYNFPFIEKVIEIPDLHHGVSLFKAANYKHIYQITQCTKFSEYKAINANHSLIDTPLCIGRELGIQDFDQRPVVQFTNEELSFGNSYKAQLNEKPVIAVECIAKSGQSWADKAAINLILSKHLANSKVLWLSNQGAPKHPNVDDLLRYSRRQIITLLQHCDIFYSVGSGFFCANLALEKHMQPKKVICMWIDDLYRYEHRLSKEAWHEDIVWVHNHNELQAAISSIDHC